MANHWTSKIYDAAWTLEWLMYGLLIKIIELRKDEGLSGNTSRQYKSTDRRWHTDCNGRLTLVCFHDWGSKQSSGGGLMFYQTDSPHIRTALTGFWWNLILLQTSPAFSREVDQSKLIATNYKLEQVQKSTQTGQRTAISSPRYRYQGPPISLQQNLLLPSQKLQRRMETPVIKKIITSQASLSTMMKSEFLMSVWCCWLFALYSCESNQTMKQKSWALKESREMSKGVLGFPKLKKLGKSEPKLELVIDNKRFLISCWHSWLEHHISDKENYYGTQNDT